MESRDDKVFGAINGLLVLLLALICAYPILYMLFASISNPAAVLRGEVFWGPKEFTIASYRQVFRHKLFVRSYGNTLLYVTVGTCINLVMTTLGAFVLSRRKFPGKTFFVMVFTFTMFFNGGLIPNYLVVKKLNLINTIWALTLPGAISMWNLIIMRNFFQTGIPYELQEAAQIDGCSHFRTLASIVLPLSGPVVAVMVMYYGVGHWNAYFNAMIYISDQTRYPLQIILRQVLLENDMTSAQLGTETTTEQILMTEGLKYAIVVVASAPIMMIYPLLQRCFVKGVMIGAIKG